MNDVANADARRLTVAEGTADAAYQRFLDWTTYIKTGLAFQGVSGWVNFTGNDKAETLALKQVRGADFVTVGYVFTNGSSRKDMNGGASNESWRPAKPDEDDEFPYMIFQVLTPILCICCPALAGCIRHN